MVPICSSMCVLISLIFHAFLSFLRCIWIFPMLEIQRLYFQWSLSQQASSAFHSKAKQVSKPVRTRVNQYGQVLHFNQHLLLCPMFLLLLPLDQRWIYTQAYTLIQPIQTNHHLLTQTSFQTQIHQHKESAQLYYPSVLHHTPLWILHLLITTIHHSIQHHSVQAPQYTGKVQQVQSIILLNRLHYQNCIHHHHHFQCHTKWYWTKLSWLISQCCCYCCFLLEKCLLLFPNTLFIFLCICNTVYILSFRELYFLWSTSYLIL